MALSKKRGKNRCKTPKRWHKASKSCRTPCSKSHGSAYRRSPKGPYYKCILKSNRKRSKK